MIQRRSEGEISMISIYVDDFLIASNNEQHLTSSSARGEASSAIPQRIAHLGLIYNQNAIERERDDRFHSPQPFGLIGYADSNFAGDPEERMSVLVYCLFMAGSPVSWSIGQLSRHNADPRLGQMQAAKRRLGNRLIATPLEKECGYLASSTR